MVNNANELPEDLKRARELSNKATGDTLPGVSTNKILNDAGDGSELPSVNNAGDILRSVTKQATEELDNEIEITETRKAVQNSSGPNSMKSTPKELGDGWIRIDVPSKCVPYDDSVTDIYIKPFSIPDLEKIHYAMDTKSVSTYIDALDGNVSIDIRDCTMGDFVFIQYMLRILSYPKSPYVIEYNSRYGNKDLKTTISKSDLSVIELEMTKNEYKEWKARGISFPTLRESEAIREITEDLENDKDSVYNSTFIFTHAQYMHIDEPYSIDTFRKKMDMFRNHDDPQIIADIEEFAELAKHGVVESIQVQDTDFEPEKAVVYLREEAQRLTNLADALSKNNTLEGLQNSAAILKIAEEAMELLEEADEIENTIKEGGEYTPRKETIPLRSIQPMDMFPTYSGRKSI